MIVNEIFGSINGEGIQAGELATFIRLAGCNLRCGYCDTTYALKKTDGKEMSIEQIAEQVEKIGYKNITLTGGEPLIHKNVENLIDALIEKKYQVNIETNGAVDIGKYIKKNVVITLDYKTVSSGMNNHMIRENFSKLRENDVLKIVLSETDFSDVEDLLKNNEINSWIYLSPIHGEIEPVQIVEFMKRLHNCGTKTDKIRLQLQIHKIIWKPEERGV